MYPIKQKDNSDMFGEINSQIINTLESNLESNSPKNLNEKKEIKKGNTQKINEENREKYKTKVSYLSKEEVKHINSSSKKSNSVIGSYANYSFDKQKRVKCENKDNIINKTSNTINLHPKSPYHHNAKNSQKIENVNKNTKENIEDSSFTEYKDYVKEEKIAQLICDEYKKKLVKYCANNSNLNIQFKLSMHFLNALIEYDKPYNTILKHIKSAIENHCQHIQQEGHNKINKLKEELEFQKKENQLLENEIIKIQNSKNNEKKLKTNEIEIFKHNSSDNVNHVVAKRGVVIPKLDLTMIINSRKPEKLIVVYPDKKDKELSKSMIEFSNEKAQQIAYNSKYIKKL